jgi:hypothetical protein
MTKVVSVAEYRELSRKNKTPKYRNKKCSVDGHRFDSIAEARRYIDLRLLEKAGKIQALTLQPSFDLSCCSLHICRYVGDFQYLEDGKRVVEDVKGVRTRDYRIKKKMVRAIYGIQIVEIS